MLASTVMQPVTTITVATCSGFLSVCHVYRNLSCIMLNIVCCWAWTFWQLYENMYGVFVYHSIICFIISNSKQCFDIDTVGWVEGTISGLLKTVMRCWLGHLSGARCKWFTYDPAYTTAIPSSLVSVKSRMLYPSGTGLLRLSWEKDR